MKLHEMAIKSEAEPFRAGNRCLCLDEKATSLYDMFDNTQRFVSQTEKVN